MGTFERAGIPVGRGAAGGLWIALLLVFLLTAACSPEMPGAQTQATPEQAAPQNQPPGQSPETRSFVQLPPGQAGSTVAARVYQANGESVVNITSVAIAQSFFGAPTQSGGVGSGFILDGQGHIVTNNHVVEDANQLNVTFKDGTTVPAQLVGRDVDLDLAVIKVDPDSTSQEGRAVRDLIKPVQLGDSDRIVIGEDAVAIGSPLGLRQTVTSGIVSAVRHPDEEGAQGQLPLLAGAIQTDAAINPGNSGGPLFNASGQVIGVNTAILSQSGGNIGIGFAIPVNMVKRVSPALINRGCYLHPIIGVSTVPLSVIGQATKRQLGLPVDQKGLLVQEASAGAASAGIRGGEQLVNLGGVLLRTGGDIVVAVDGRPVATGGELRAYIENNRRPGDTVTVTILRDGQQTDVQVALAERPGSDTCR